MLVDKVGAMFQFRKGYEQRKAENSKAPLAWAVRDMHDWPGFSSSMTPEALYLFIVEALDLVEDATVRTASSFIMEMQHYRYCGLPGETVLGKFHNYIEEAMAKGLSRLAVLVASL